MFLLYLLIVLLGDLFYLKQCFFPYYSNIRIQQGKEFAKHLVKNLKEFEKIDCLPLNLRGFCEKYNISEDLYSEMLNDEDVLCKSCSLLYNKVNLYWKHKSYEKPSQNKRENISDDTLEIPKKWLMRTSIIEKLCNFYGCGKSVEERSWHQYQTLVLHSKVKTIATELSDHKLLAKLSEVDMVATEAVYHLNCLNELYNKYWSFYKTSFREPESNFIEGTFNNILVI